MRIKDFLKGLMGRKVKEDIDVVINKQQKPSIDSNEQYEEVYSKRDLQYARRIGQLEKLSEDISNIKDKITQLDVKFDLRVPDKVLTENKFDEEVAGTGNVFSEFDNVKQGINELRKIIISKQQITTREKAEELVGGRETDLRETEIKNMLIGERITASELGNRIGLSRSRTNQILLQMEQKRVVSRLRYGKKFLWYVT